MAIGPIIIALLIVGFLIYMVTTVPIPINPWVKNLIIGIIFIGLVIWLLNMFGISTGGIHLTKQDLFEMVSKTMYKKELALLYTPRYTVLEVNKGV